MKSITWMGIVLILAIPASLHGSEEPAPSTDYSILDVYADPLISLYGLAADRSEFAAGVEFGRYSWGNDFWRGPIFVEFRITEIDESDGTMGLIGLKSYYYPRGRFLGGFSRAFRGASYAFGVGLVRTEETVRGVDYTSRGFTFQSRFSYKFLSSDRVGFEPYVGFGLVMFPEEDRASSNFHFRFGGNMSLRILPFHRP